MTNSRPIDKDKKPYSQNQIGGELLKLLGVDPEHCSHAEIVLDANSEIRVTAEFVVFPLVIDETLGSIKKMTKEFVLVEIEKKDDDTEATDAS